MPYRRSFGSDVKALLRKLLLGYRSYFSNDVLNSEGRKIFEETVRMLIYEHPEFKPIIRKTRRNPTIDNVLKVAKLVLGDEEVERLFLIATRGYFRFWISNNSASPY